MAVMMRPAFALIALALAAPLALAQDDVLIDVERPRGAGLLDRTPVRQRAILSRPAQPTDTALLFFRGSPGYARIQTVADKDRNLNRVLRASLARFHEAGIAVVIVDCPTDQWGSAFAPTSCYDGYRSSREHADDVRGVMNRLREEHGLTRFFVMGHSIGSISSRWLALHLGREIAGSIHSASMNRPTRAGFGGSVARFPYQDIVAPALHVHHESDACPSTPYAAVKAYAGESLATVRGGIAEGDPCGGGHLHSYQGREQAVGQAIVDWIRTGKAPALVGE